MPQQNRKKSRLFFGWWSVTFIGIASGLGHGFNTYGISVFFKHIAGELKLDRATTSWAPGIGRLEGGITSPLVGWLSDKFGPRWMVIIGLIVAGTGMVLMNYITEVWQYLVAWGGLIGLGLNIGLTVAVDKNINDWFIRRRGLAQGIKFGLVSLVGIAVVQVITLIIEYRDWRSACLAWGIIMYACIPLAYILIKPRRPEYYGLLPDGADIGEGGSTPEELIQQGIGYASSLQETEYSYKQATRTATFWLLVVGFSAHNVIASGFNLHVYPFLTDLGIDEATAGGMLGMMIFFTAPSRFFGGLVADKVRKDRMQLLLVGSFLFQVIGISTYLISGSLASVYVLLVCYGLSTGAITPLIILMLGRYFGRKAFGSLLGTMVAFLAPMGMLAPVFYGWIYDTTLSYDNAFITSL
ncbi:MAG: MFS transporter, partial [Dehalococcoidales bacterium]|nr:MFS transporter [Dehalococcoidales bacterium]